LTWLLCRPPPTRLPSQQCLHSRRTCRSTALLHLLLPPMSWMYLSKCRLAEPRQMQMWMLLETTAKCPSWKGIAWCPIHRMSERLLTLCWCRTS
jgi:hypothetical protein